MATIELDKEIIIKRYYNGDSSPIIAKDYNANQGTIYYYLKKWGVKTRKLQKYPKISDNIDQILSMHLDGKSCYQIGNILNIPDVNIARYLKIQGYDLSHNNKNREDKLINHEEYIIGMYLSGLSTVKIGKHFNASPVSILRILKKHNIDSRPKSIYSVDESYFEKIDNEAKAYILGWIYSDGNVVSDKWRIQIQEEDAYMLEWIAKQVQYNGPLYVVPPPIKFPHRKWQRCLSVARNKMVGDLAKLGVIPKKSLILGFPTIDQVPIELMNHFLRGVMDGDGSIKREKNYINCSFVCSSAFSQGFINFLKLDSSVYNIYDKKKSKQIMFTQTEYAIKFLDYIYKDSTINLTRKYNKYLNKCET